MVDCYQNQREGHTKKIQLQTPVERKLTLVIWTPKLEGFAFNTSAENVTSQRKKESKNITRVEERKKKKEKNQASITRELWGSVPAILQSRNGASGTTGLSQGLEQGDTHGHAQTQQ